MSLLIFFFKFFLSPLLLLNSLLVSNPVYLNRNFVLSVTSEDVCRSIRNVKQTVVVYYRICTFE